uniref:Ig-like domain-containing protein n=1 Tax=Gouania willdenowi TaxID=441366 RepID=A0A8C5HNV5_GOUWI
MLTLLLTIEVLGVFLVPVGAQLIAVCIKPDNNLRVDCLIEPKPNVISSYEFSWSTGTKETLINTNVSGSAADTELKDRSYVEQRDPHGYSLTMIGFTDGLPHNTTYLCKMSGVVAQINVEKSQLVTCSTISSSCVTLVFNANRALGLKLTGSLVSFTMNGL